MGTRKRLNEDRQYLSRPRHSSWKRSLVVMQGMTDDINSLYKMNM